MTALETLPISPFVRGEERKVWNDILQPLNVPAKYRRCIACICHQHGVCTPSHLKELLDLHQSPDGMQKEFQGFTDEDFPEYFRGVRDKVEYLLELPAIFSPDSPDNFYG